MSARLAAVCLVALAAGCSALGFAYNHADAWLRWQAGRYLDLDAGQTRELDARIDAFLAWHRAEALPQYARLAEEAGARLARRISQADLVWGYDALRTQFREGLRRAGADLGVVLDRVQPAQIERLERRLAEDNRKFARDHLAGGPEERRSRRMRRTTRLLGDWIGELSDAQRERVRQFGEQAPLIGELRDRDRRRRQAEFVAMLRTQQSAQRLADWAAEWDRDRDPAYAGANRAWVAEFFAMLVDLDRMMSARQRQHAIARLRGFARDFELLAAAR